MPSSARTTCPYWTFISFSDSTMWLFMQWIGMWSVQLIVTILVKIDRGFDIFLRAFVSQELYGRGVDADLFLFLFNSKRFISVVAVVVSFSWVAPIKLWTVDYSLTINLIHRVNCVRVRTCYRSTHRNSVIKGVCFMQPHSSRFAIHCAARTYNLNIHRK